MAKNRYVYVVEYRMTEHSDVESVRVIASSKWEAYDIAMYEKIPEIHAYSPYSAWVYAIQYNNGNYRVIAKSESMY